MDKMIWGDVLTIGITTSNLISIEFYNPGLCDDNEFSTICLTIEQAKMIARFVRILENRTIKNE